MGILLKKGPYKSEKRSVDSKKKMAEYIKRIEEVKVAQEVLEEVASQKQFEKWLSTISKEEKDELVVPNNLIDSGSKRQVVMLKVYWEGHIEDKNLKKEKVYGKS